MLLINISYSIAEPQSKKKKKKMLANGGWEVNQPQ